MLFCSSSIISTHCWIPVVAISLFSYISEVKATTTAGVSSSQMNGLESLYNSTAGNNWIWPSSSTGNHWDFTTGADPCLDEWDGITCDDFCSNMTSCTITSLQLPSFNLVGTIPPEINLLTGLQYFSLGHNSLYGSLPSSLGMMTNLISVELDTNQLESTIPTSMGFMSSLQMLYLRENKLVGEIPSILGNLNLTTLYLDRNSFSKTIPSSLGSISTLGLLYLHENSLTGRIPTSFLLLSALSFLSLSFNELTHRVDGVLPSTMTNVYLNSNKFTGTFPSVFINSSSLVTLDIGRNSFVGTIPSTIQLLSNLKNIIAGSNQFTGDINDLFTDTGFVNQLMAVDLTENGFTGSLPDVLFSSQSIEVIALSKNCFVGQLTDSICNAVNVSALSLSGLTAGNPCVISYTSLGASFTTVDHLAGSIPTCIFSMPRLETMYIAGNGIQSYLAPIPVNSTLINISLAYNRIHGTIPMSIQRDNNVMSLNLAFNRLVGSIKDLSIGSSNNVYLETNRLSGDLPQSLEKATNVNILRGNLFQCYKRRTLPEHDPQLSNYICASDTLDAYSFSYCGVFLVAAGIAYYGYLFVKKLLPSTENKYPNFFEVVTDFAKIALKYLRHQEYEIASHAGVDRFAYYCHKFRKACFLMAASIVVVMLPTYMLFKFIGFGTYTYQYGWLPSAAYMHHPTAAFVISILVIIIVRYAYVFHHDDEVILQVHEERESIIKHRQHSILARSQNYPYIIMWFVVNLVVVCIANGLYVYALLKTTAVVQVFLTLLVVAFKLVWNSTVIIPKIDQLEGSLNILLLTFACNSVVFPVLATMFVDIDCFQSLFVSTPSISASFMVPSYLCLKFSVEGDCVGILPYIGAINFSAPYEYSDQCSSSMLTKYVPVYILIYGMVYTVISVLQAVVMAHFGPLYKYPTLRTSASTTTSTSNSNSREDEDQASGSQVQTARKTHVTKTKKGEAHTTGADSGTDSDSGTGTGPAGVPELEESVCHNPEHKMKIAQLEFIWRNIDLWDSCTGGIVSRMTIPIQCAENMRKTTADTFYCMKVRLLNYLMTLMFIITFGLAYPPLAIVLVVCLVVQTIIMQVCIHLHREQMRRMPHLYDQWNEIFNEDVLLTGKILFGRRPFVYVFAVLFMSFFLVDNVINTNYVAAITIPFVLCIVIVFVLYNPMKGSIMRLAEESRNALTALANIDLTLPHQDHHHQTHHGGSTSVRGDSFDDMDVEMMGVSSTPFGRDTMSVQSVSIENPIHKANNKEKGKQKSSKKNSKSNKDKDKASDE